MVQNERGATSRKEQRGVPLQQGQSIGGAAGCLAAAAWFAVAVAAHAIRNRHGSCKLVAEDIVDDPTTKGWCLR